MAAAPVAVDPVLVAGAVTTGATAAVVRCAALIFVETGSLPPPARGRNISSPAIAMTTAATPADAYSTVRFLRAGSGESAWTGAIVDRQSPSAASLTRDIAVRDIRENGIAMRDARFATGDAPGRTSALGWGDDDLGSRRRLYRRCHQRGGRHRGGDRRRLRTFA